MHIGFGTVVYHSEARHLRWREIDGGALEVVTFPASADGFDSGGYYFELKAKGSSFELTFLKGFGGRYLKDFKRTGKKQE